MNDNVYQLDDLSQFTEDDEERVDVKPVDNSQLKRIELTDWNGAQTVLKVLLDNGYMAVLTKCERTYVIEYDWQDSDWSGKVCMWVEAE